MRRTTSTRRWCAVLLLAIGTCWLSSCQTTHFYERRRLADGCMQFDANGRLAYIRSKIEAAREGSLGGFGAGTAGGCGCQ